VWLLLGQHCSMLTRKLPAAVLLLLLLPAV
jgi:hypothetical protein